MRAVSRRQPTDEAGDTDTVQTTGAPVINEPEAIRMVNNRHELGKRFIRRIIKDESNVLFYLLPAKRDVQLTTRLRCARQYPTIYARTNRHKNSFILFGLHHFQ